MSKLNTNDVHHSTRTHAIKALTLTSNYIVCVDDTVLIFFISYTPYDAEEDG